VTDPPFDDPSADQPGTVRCRDVHGTLHTMRLTAVDVFSSPGARLPTRMVSADGGPPLLQKWVARTSSGEPGPLDPLDREVRAVMRFALVFAKSYPAELPRLRYYDVDGDDPFVLLEPYRGMPVAEVRQQLAARDRYWFQVGLLKALHLAGAAGITHGGVGFDTLRWDAATRTVQLIDFEQAVRVGDPRSGTSDGGPADVRDDVWDAGLTIWRSAHPDHSGREAPDLSSDGGALRALLAGVFVDPPAARPTPEDMLAGLGEPTALQEPTALEIVDPGAPLREGLRTFDATVERTRALRAEEAQVNRPQPWGARFWTTLTGAGKRPQPAEAAEPALVRCPVCLDSYPWPDEELWLYDDKRGQYIRDTSSVRDPLRQEFLRLNSYRRCPNPSGDFTAHYLPATYHAFRTPLVVAMVGGPAAGKTHLLAAIIREVVEHGALTPYGLSAGPLDLHRHAEYWRTVIKLTEQGVQLPGTRERLTDPVYILLVRGPSGTWPVTFFDVAGEDLQAVGEADKLGRFLIGTNAVIFVHGLEPIPERSGNQAFEMSLAKLRIVQDHARLPAVIVATKSDRLRYRPPIDRWLRTERDPLSPVNAELLHSESRDVYAFLHHRREHAALAPFSVFDRCTLHFASASGSEAAAQKELFPRGFEPSRVLEPLIAILAMAGMIEGEQARRVGT